MRVILLVWCMVFMVGCTSNKTVPVVSPARITYEEMLTKNQANINRLSVGMTKQQVLAVMGKYTAEFDDGPVPNPAFSEAETKDGSVYETMYFVTVHHPPFVTIKKWQTTAVRFQDGKVTGWGPPGE